MSDYHNHQKKIALINDMTGFGRCSIAVALPVISMLRVQCCALPTAIFSNHTGFESFYYQDYTDHMQPSINEWKKLGLEFSGICTGFLKGNVRSYEGSCLLCRYPDPKYDRGLHPDRYPL